jgi:hypothetical protein
MVGRRFYALWLFAAFLGAAGAAGDVSWHFSRLFDELSPPHDVATTGFIINIALLWWALVRQRERVTGPERTGLLINAAGLAVFLVATPLDLGWHLIFGIDITTWSPTHLLLFYSAVLGQAGMLLAWLSSPTGRQRGAWVITFCIALLMVSATVFPFYQQEYAAVALDSLVRTGRAPWYVAPDMWALAGTQAQKLARNGTPDWLYPVGEALLLPWALTFSAGLMRARFPEREGSAPADKGSVWHGFGAATGLIAAYLLLRLLARGIFHLVGMPIAVIPVWQLALALAVDGALLVAASLPAGAWVARLPLPRWAPARVRQEALVAALGSVVGTLAVYATMAGLRAAHAVEPPMPLATLPFALVMAAFGAGIGGLLAARVVQVASTAAAPEHETLAAVVPPSARVGGRRSFSTMRASWRATLIAYLTAWRHL